MLFQRASSGPVVLAKAPLVQIEAKHRRSHLFGVVKSYKISLVPDAPSPQNSENVESPIKRRPMYVRQSPYVATILTPRLLPWESHSPIVQIKSHVAPPLNDRNMKLSDLAIVHQIGEGSCGKVFQVRDRVTDRTFALKVIRKKNLHPEDLDATLLEQKILLANTGSSHLLSLDASFHDTMNFYFVVPYTPLGDLHSEIERSGTLSAPRARFFMAELLLGLNALQVLGVIHRDIKPANLLIGSTGHLTIADFGLARSFAAQPERAIRRSTDLPLGPYQTQSSCGTWPFMSPELIRGRPYSFEGDIWAAGVTLYVMLFGRIPWGEGLNADDRHLICKTPLRFNNYLNVDGVTKYFLTGMLAKRPSQRMSMSEIKSHKYFDGLNWAAMSAGVCPVPEARVPLFEQRAPPHDALYRYGQPIGQRSVRRLQFLFASDGSCRTS